MADRREQIMARMIEALAGVDGITTLCRNEIDFDDTQLPAVSVLEGEEIVDLDNDNDTRGPNAPQRITAMIPVFIRTKGIDAGTTGNALRIKVQAAVLNDATLRALARRVRYFGMKTQLFPAMLTIGGIAPMFAITYIAKPGDIDEA